MNIKKQLCEKLYSEMKNIIQDEFNERGITFSGSETALWKCQHPKQDKTYFQLLLEEKTKLSFSGTFNHMYLWRKMNETNSREMINFQEDYLILFIKYLGFANPQEYIKSNSQTLHHFLGIENEGEIAVIQPLFDANSIASLENGKFPRLNEQTVDSKDTECLLALISLFHDFNRILPKRIYDQDLVEQKEDCFILNETVLDLTKTSCIFSIGFYSNNFFKWVLQNYAHDFIRFEQEPVRFSIKYFNETLQQKTWTDFYVATEDFDAGFLMKYSVNIKDKETPCYFFCGIENRATKAMTDYLCSHWKVIQEKQDFERNRPIENRSFITIFKVRKDNLKEIYSEKTIILD